MKPRQGPAQLLNPFHHRSPPEVRINGCPLHTLTPDIHRVKVVAPAAEPAMASEPVARAKRQPVRLHFNKTASKSIGPPSPAPATAACAEKAPSATQSSCAAGQHRILPPALAEPAPLDKCCSPSRSASPRSGSSRSRSTSCSEKGRNRRCSASREAERRLKQLVPSKYLSTVDAAGGSGRWMRMSWRERHAFYDKLQEKKAAAASKKAGAPNREQQRTPAQNRPTPGGSAPLQRRSRSPRLCDAARELPRGKGGAVPNAAPAVALTAPPSVVPSSAPGAAQSQDGLAEDVARTARSKRRARAPGQHPSTMSAAGPMLRAAPSVVPSAASSAELAGVPSAVSKQCWQSVTPNAERPGASAQPAGSASDALEEKLKNYPAEDLETATEAVGGPQKWRRMSVRERLNAVARVLASRETELDELLHSATESAASQQRSRAHKLPGTEVNEILPKATGSAASPQRSRGLRSPGSSSSDKKRPSSMPETGQTTTRELPLAQRQQLSESNLARSPASESRRASSVSQLGEEKLGHYSAFDNSSLALESQAEEDWSEASSAADEETLSAGGHTWDSPTTLIIRPSAAPQAEDDRLGKFAATGKSRPSSELRCRNAPSRKEGWPRPLSKGEDAAKHSTATGSGGWRYKLRGRLKARPSSMPGNDEVWLEGSSATDIPQPSSMRDVEQDWPEVLDVDMDQVSSSLQAEEGGPGESKRPSSVLADDDFMSPQVIEEQVGQFVKPSSVVTISDPVSRGSPAPEETDLSPASQADEVWPETLGIAENQLPSSMPHTEDVMSGEASTESKRHLPMPRSKKMRASLAEDIAKPLPRPRPLLVQGFAAPAKTPLPMPRGREMRPLTGKKPSAASSNAAEKGLERSGTSFGPKQWEPEEDDEEEEAFDQTAEMASSPVHTESPEMDRHGFQAAVEWLNKLPRSDDDVAVSVLESLLQARPALSLLRKVDWKAALAPQLHMTEGSRRSLAASIVEKWTQLRNRAERELSFLEASRRDATPGAAALQKRRRRLLKG